MHRISVVSPLCQTAIGLSLLLASVTMAHAATVRNVPATYPSIQAAINAAVNGDTVLVAPGVYKVTNLDTLGKAITLKSTGGAGTCILDGASANTILNIQKGELATTIINGFTFQHGAASGCGGAVYIQSSSPTISNCVFQFNTASSGGGAIASFSGSPKITNSTFQNNSGDLGGGLYLYSGLAKVSTCVFNSNTATGGLGGGGVCANGFSHPSLSGCTFQYNNGQNGGGIYILDNASATLSKCSFTTNFAKYGGGISFLQGTSKLTGCTFTGGGGLWISNSYQSCNPALTNCLFDGDSALYGGAILNTGGNPTIGRCLFFANEAGASGGGLYAGSGKPVLVNCVFAENTTNFASGGPGAALCFNGSNTSAHVTNCSFSGNIGPSYGDGIYADNAAVVAVANSILWDKDAPNFEIESYNGASVTVTYSDVFSGWGGTGNINSDPLYADPANWYLYLQAGSPCLNAGSPGVAYFPKTDMVGTLRSTLAPDMGAYEIP